MSWGNCNQEPGFVLRQRIEHLSNWSLKEGVKVPSTRRLNVPQVAAACTCSASLRHKGKESSPVRCFVGCEKSLSLRIPNGGGLELLDQQLNVIKMHPGSVGTISTGGIGGLPSHPLNKLSYLCFPSQSCCPLGAPLSPNLGWVNPVP